MNNLNPEKIVIMNDGIIRIIVRRVYRDFNDNVFSTEVLFNPCELKWHFDEDRANAYITLAEIESELIKSRYKPPFYVWYETELSGVIYQYGNYNPLSWIIYGRIG